MKKLLIPILCLLIYTCDSGSSPNSPTPTLDLCGIENGNDINEDGYHCGDIQVLQDFIDANESLNSQEPINIGTQAWDNNRLTSLDLYNTQISIVPESIGTLDNLNTLYLYGNTISSLPITICDLNDNCTINVNTNNICEESHYECIDYWTPQNQSNCIVGCMDDTGCNYDVNATYDDGSCTYTLQGEDCDGNCIDGFDLCGICGGNNINEGGYHCGDIQVLQDLIDINEIDCDLDFELNSSINPNQSYFGLTWDEGGRLVEINSQSSSSSCISQPQISQLPSSIENLDNLELLYMTTLNLSTLPESFSNLINLKYLSLGSNPFTEFPNVICNFENLEMLSFGTWSDDITEIPECIGNLTTLINLSLHGNAITNLPTSIGNLINLTLLSIRNNTLETLPESIGNLINLNSLDAKDNELSSLPLTLCNLGEETFLEFSGNNLCEEYHYECLNNSAWDGWPLNPQDQSNCCEGPNGEPNWTTCP